MNRNTIEYRQKNPAEAVVYDSGAVDAIKNCLMKIGPVYAEVCHMPNEPAEKGGVNEYENWEYGSMYYPLWTDETIAGHAVTIVGWDDHYSRDLFGENTPPGDGAFLIKNSFGKMDGDSNAGDQSLFREGYFWLSYYDATIQTPAAFTGTLVEDGNYVFKLTQVSSHTGLRPGVDRGTEWCRVSNIFTFTFRANTPVKPLLFIQDIG